MSKDGKQPYPWYFETIVWAWDSEKRERGEMLHMDDSGSEPISALGKHNYICLSLLTGRPLED